MELGRGGAPQILGGARLKLHTDRETTFLVGFESADLADQIEMQSTRTSQSRIEACLKASVGVFS